jgi:hypothetical protein
MTRNLGGRPRRMPNDREALRALAEQYRAAGSIRALVSDTGYAYGTIQRNLKLAQLLGYCVVRPVGGARVVPNVAALRAQSG